MDVARHLLSSVVATKDLDPVLEAGITSSFFEDPKSKAVYETIVKHASQYGGVPSLSSLIMDFPDYKFIKVDDTTDYLIDQVRHRHKMALIEQGLASSVDAYDSDDPETVLQILSDVMSQVAAEGAGAAGADASWRPVDLADALRGPADPVRPTLLPRLDGACLLYPGLTHSFHGESESGKSLVLQIETARLISAGARVLFVDFESDPHSVTQRLLEFGASEKSIIQNLDYVHPEMDHQRDPAETAQWDRLLDQPYALAVIDGVTDALGTYGYKTNENDDIAAWMRKVPNAIASATGAAVAMIDHVTKSSDTRGRFAIGGQAKMAGLTGAAYLVEVTQVLGRGLRGEISIRIAKDRPGSVRGFCGPQRKDRTQEAARVVIDSTQDQPDVRILPPSTGGDDSVAFRPTGIMEAVSRIVEDSPGISKNQLVAAVKSRKENVDLAVELLIAEGHLSIDLGRRASHLHTVVKAYRQAEDPASDRFEPVLPPF